ncbi:hypothetical protein WJX79_009963 [Trebouxia sp. C0005]
MRVDSFQQRYQVRLVSSSTFPAEVEAAIKHLSTAGVWNGYRMPASGTMVAPFGRVMSGRGFAPGSFQLHDIPSAGQFTKDLPIVGNKPNIDVWLQQAKTADSMQLLGKAFLNSSVRPVVRGPLLPSGTADDVEVHNPAKRQRLSIPEYGRSVSDPPLSFVRRSANAVNMPVEALKLDSLRRPPPADLPKALRSIQSGPVRSTERRPSPNYRIYSNAFQGGRVSGDGALFNYSNSKAANASSMTKTALSSGDTNNSNAVADTHDRSPHGSSRRSPVPFSRGGASPRSQCPAPFGDVISSRPKGAASSRDGASPRVYSGMLRRDHAEQGLGMLGHSQLKLPSRKSDSSKCDLAPKGQAARPWNNLSSALQPPVSPLVTDTEPVTKAQLQSIMASCMKKNGDHRDEAVVNISEAKVEQWLSQLAEAPGKSNAQRPNLPGMTSQELLAAQNPNLPRPIQAQLHVMRNSFNRVSRPNMADQPHLPAYSSAPVTASFPLGGLEHHRRLLAPRQETGIPRVASVNSMQPSPINSSTRSSLPPSVASWLEQDQQQQQQLPGRSQLGVSQQGYGFGREAGQGQSIASFSGVESPYGQRAQSGHVQGYAQSGRPVESVRDNGGKDWYDNLGSGYGLPSRVIAEGGVRNPALLNRPVLSSHRDPQPGPRDSDSGFYRPGAKVQQGPLVLPQKSFSFLNSGAAQRAQHDGLSPGAAAVSFPPNFSSMQNPAAAPNMNALAAMLGGSNLSSADVSQLCSLAGNRNAGDLNQLISQMLVASQLAQAQAAESANEEPSELLMLAAETLAGLNMQPRSSGDQPRSASAGLDDSSNESPPLPVRRLSKHPAVAKHRSRKLAPSCKPAGHTSSTAAAHAYGSGASVHPVLGLYVPHARRSYHRDGTALGARGSSMASSGHCEGRAPNGKGNMVGNDGQLEGKAPFASSRPHAAAPARGRQRIGSLTAAAHAKPAAVMHRMPSDSSMTVSADSNA